MINITDRQVQQKELLVHFPIPASKLWDNVLFSCANMLVFTTEAQVDEWCKRHHIAKGEVHSIEKVWALARRWYGNYLDPAWTRKEPGYAQELLESTGFTGDFWKVKKD